jgi:hypothetical protein
LDPAKLDEQLNAKNKPLPKQMSADEENDFVKKAKIQVPLEYHNKYEELMLKHNVVFSKNNQGIRNTEHFEHIFLKITSPGSKSNTQFLMLTDLHLKCKFKNGSKWALFNKANPDTAHQCLWYQKRMPH